MTSRNPHDTRIPAPRMHPVLRRRTFAEVTCGYAPWQAVAEANRCRFCADAPCVSACPMEMDVPAFIEQVADGEFEAAYDRLVAYNPLPGICSRVCPQDAYCELPCGTPGGFQPLGIGRIERFIADWAAARNRPRPPIDAAPSGHAVAVIGAGPAGLTAAADLARLGHSVTVFEAADEPGGTLTRSYPEFRLPRAVVDREIRQLLQMGIGIRTKHEIGQAFTIDELFGDLGYEAVLLATGAGAPTLPDIADSGLSGIFTAESYFSTTRITSSDERAAAARGGQVVVIGSGDKAIDAARAAVRLGADKVSVVSRGVREQMPARSEDVEYALEEGVQVLFLAEPIEIVETPGGRVGAVRFQEMTQHDGPTSLACSVPIADARFILDADVVIFADDADPDCARGGSGLAGWGALSADLLTGATQRKGLFAGGHILTGSATVPSAMAAGRRAARAIHNYLQMPLPDGC